MKPMKRDEGEAATPKAAAAAAAAAAAVVAPSKAPTVQGEATAPKAAAAAVVASVDNDGWGRWGPPPSDDTTVERPYAVYVDDVAYYLSRRPEHFYFGRPNKRKRFQGYSSSSEDEGSYVSKEEVNFEAMKDEDLFVIDRVGNSNEN